MSTCGANNHHVLGHSPPPPYLLSPRPIAPNLLKSVGGQICGIAAACYTSVFWTDNSVYTFGLNGGQLGHPLQQSKSIITPKQVNFTLATRNLQPSKLIIFNYTSIYTSVGFKMQCTRIWTTGKKSIFIQFLKMIQQFLVYIIMRTTIFYNFLL